MSKFETGEENAQRFVKVVGRLATEERHIVMSASPIVNSERGGWVWMHNAEWRARVKELLADYPVGFPTFHKADHLGDSSFSAISRSPTHKIEQLSINDTLSGEQGGFVKRAARAAKPALEFVIKLAAALGFVVGLIYTAVQLSGM